MDDFNLKSFILGELFNNVYVISEKKTKKAFIIDAPYGFEEIFNYIKKENLDVSFVLLTHAHFDHIAGLNLLNFPFYMHSQDLILLKEPNLNGSYFFGSSVIIDKKPIFYNSFLSFGSYKIEVIHTPGHTPGSVSLKFGKWLFSGDTLFYDSIGRTDTPLASYEILIKSIYEKILTLPADTIIYPGHGKSTSLEREAKYNPFLSKKYEDIL